MRSPVPAILILALGALTSCQTSRHKEFAGIKEGMEKDLVIEQAGGPNVSRRYNGKDRWIYNYSGTPEGLQTKEVHFENGRAVYVGSKVVPKVGAAEQDKLNEQSNEAVAQRDAAEVARWNEEHGVANSLKTGDQLDHQDDRIQQSMYGTVNKQRERAKVAPKFESID